MIRTRLPALTLALTLPALVAGGAVAQGADSTAAQAATSPELSFGTAAPASSDATLSTQSGSQRLIFSLLIGGQSRPGYFGADENILIPQFRPDFLALDFGGMRIGDSEDALDDDPNDRPLGFGYGASFRYITERSSGDYSELEGLDDVDATVEIGGQVFYIWPNAEVFGQLRYGFGGSEAWVGELGAYYVSQPTDGLTLRVGPRLVFGDDQYADTYFGVSADEAANSSFSEYDPDGGLVSAGLELIATYRLGELWWLEGRARWDQFQDDAADSPIVQQGSTDQGTFSLGLRRAFVLNF